MVGCFLFSLLARFYPLHASVRLAEYSDMLKRAKIALISAAVPGFLAYTGWVDVLTPSATFAAFALLYFSAISFLLALFEDEDPPKVAHAPVPVPVINNPRGSVKAAELVLNEQPEVVRVAP